MSSFAEPSRLKVILDGDDAEEARLEAVRAVSHMLLKTRVSCANYVCVLLSAIGPDVRTA